MSAAVEVSAAAIGLLSIPLDHVSARLDHLREQTASLQKILEDVE